MSNLMKRNVFLVLILTTVYSSASIHDLNQKPKAQLHEEQQQEPTSHNLKRVFHQSLLNPSHKYWFNKNHPSDSILSSARQWNYCDYKCLYLEKYNTNKDFVVIVMGAFLKQDFSACYVKNGQQYTLWNQIMSNNFYEQNCGQDQTDWMKSGKFDVKGIYGVGIGTKLNETQIYS